MQSRLTKMVVAAAVIFVALVGLRLIDRLYADVVELLHNTRTPIYTMVTHTGVDGIATMFSLTPAEGYQSTKVQADLSKVTENDPIEYLRLWSRWTVDGSFPPGCQWDPDRQDRRRHVPGGPMLRPIWA